MGRIQSLSAYPILDSRGQTTIEVNLTLDNGNTSTASVPSGTSTGKYEARTVTTEVAIWEVNEQINSLLKNKDFVSQESLDSVLTSQDFGANSRLAVSIAFAKAANTLPIPSKHVLPKIMMLAFEGGKHAHGGLHIQEFLMIISSISEGSMFYSQLGIKLEQEGLGSDVGLEGGYSPMNLSDDEALGLLKDTFDGKLKIGLDIAASHLPKNEEFDFEKILTNYPVFSIEDPYPEDEDTKWHTLMEKFGSKFMIISDDLTVTNPERTKFAIEHLLCNAIVIKPNQVGTITETLKVVDIAKKAGLKVVVAHRAGETNDTFIADLAVAIEADYVKFGGPVRGERVAKYNRLLEIEKRWK
jgi:enolase